MVACGAPCGAIAGRKLVLTVTPSGSRPASRAVRSRSLTAGRAVAESNKHIDDSNHGSVYPGFLMPAWLRAAPRVRVRRSPSADRPLQQLAELAILNERLEGKRPWEARQKLEYFQKSKESWKAICEDLRATDAVATLERIEEAQRKVDEALSDEFRDGNSVTDMRIQLQELQAELELAHKKLNQTQTLVSMHEREVAKLQEEAESLRSMSSVRIPEPEEPARVSASTSAESSMGFTELEPSLHISRPISRPASSPPALKPSGDKAGKKRSNMLRSTLDIEEGLKDYWYPVEFSKNLTEDKLIPLEIFNNMFVLFRDEVGMAACVVDECAHRACPLSLGSVVGGQIQCPYHGWEYNGQGECTKMPSTLHCKGIQVQALDVAEKDGMVWVWTGSCEPFRPIPDIGAAPEGHVVHSEIVLEVPVEHGLLVENLLDLAHAPFTHTSTFARGWPIPDAVKFRMMSLMGGEWDPYPIDMAFEPPCMTLSLIGLQKPGQVDRGSRASDCPKHLRQMHVCLPSRPGHTRLLYRMSLDFMPMLKYIPFMDRVWKKMADMVLGEDLVLVQGQQRRMELGGDTWANPVSYDKMAVRYRRWRNSLSSTDEGEKEAAAAALNSKMSAGQLFSVDEDNMATNPEECDTLFVDEQQRFT
mmetsp:Transcript_23098/g.64158  ORF Transcript_23098/g.64158 Transcript_23098/m.64158 type:complete len:645 (+) Transcript_23098:156-2090(+)